MNYKLLTGAFEGSIVKEGQLLDVDFPSLDDDLQIRIRDWADQNLSIVGDDWVDSSGNVLTANEVKEAYENSWESEETSEPADLLPASKW